MTNPIIDLHLTCPELYDSFSNDRDFKAQCEQLIQYSGLKPTSTLELFAGAARHSDALLDLGAKNVYCVDGSEAARELALSKMHIEPNKYLVKWLPDFLDEVPDSSLDLILMIRYAACRLTHLQLFDLLKTCKQKCSENGLIFLELHQIEDILSGFNFIPIKERESHNGIVCRWPSKSPTCSANGWLFDLDVEIETSDGKRLEFVSTEYMYCFEDIRFMCGLLGLNVKIVPNAKIPSFNNSHMLVLGLNDE